MTSRSEMVDWAVHVTEDGECVPRSWASIRDGSMPWSALRDDEVYKGRLCNRQGTFDGPRMNLVCPPDQQRALIAEVHRRIEARFKESAGDMADVVEQVANGVVVGTAADQLRAATYLLERVIGKVPDRVQLDATVRPWEGLVQGILVDAPEHAEEPGSG